MATKDKILKLVSKKISLKSEAGFDPKEYYQNRHGLYVWSNFKERILSKTLVLDAEKEFAVTSADLLEDASNKKIEAFLPEKHIFDESDVCALIAQMIAKQPKGDEGDLLVTGYANIFYTSAFVVRVHWRGDGWGVAAWERDGSDWGAGPRVFSPVTNL